MRRLAPRLVVCACLLAGQGHAQTPSQTQPQTQPQTQTQLKAQLKAQPQLHPYTVDDILARQRLGAVSLSPSKTWLVVQSTAPYSQVRRFDLLSQADLTVSRLDVVDLRTAPVPRRLFAGSPDYGYLPGPYSPSGEKMAVIRVRGHAMELGVVALATGQAVWTGQTPVVSNLGSTLAWRSDDELVAVVRDPQAASFIPFYEWQAQAKLRTAWDAASTGALSVDEIGSGRYLGRHAAAPLRRLVRIASDTGLTQVVFEGDVFDLALSPDSRLAAVLAAGEDTPADPGRAAGLADPFRRQRLALIDLDEGSSWRPWADREVASGLLAWSRGGDLLVRAKVDGAAWGLAAFWRLRPQARTATPLDLGTFEAAPDPDPSGLGAARGQWMGDEPLVLAKRPGGERRTWLRISQGGPVALGADLPSAADKLVAADDQNLLLSDGARIWRVNAQGRTVLGPMAAAPTTALAAEDLRALFNERPAPNRAVLTAQDTRGAQRLATLDLAGLRLESVAIPAGETLLAAHTSPVRAVSLARSEQGVETVVLRAAGHPPAIVLTLNAGLAQTRLVRARPIAHRGPAGEALTSWLYLPPGLRPGQRAPLVVVPYPGRVWPTPAEGLPAPGRERYPNAQLLAAAGYAVLLPSLPVDETREPMDGMARRILEVVDAAAATQPVDLRRLALWGHSYGGYAVLAAATQSARFKAVISAAPSPDLFMAYAVQGVALGVPEAGYPVVNAMGWLESGQARMGAPPWRDPDRYVRNSPVLQADKITQAILLVASDLDGDPNGPRAMFNALYRQNKDALLLDYKGEGHQMFNAANLRDLYERALNFLADHVAPDPSSARAETGGS